MRYLEDDGRVTVFRSPSNNSNGNAFDHQGRQLSCEHSARRVVRYEHDGSIAVIADAYQGKRLNSPNDLAPHPDGSVWFTDPPFGGSLYEGMVDAPGGLRDREVEVLGLHLTEAGRRELFAAMGVDDSPSSVPWEPVAVNPARHTMVSPTAAGASDAVDEESTNHLDGERETAAGLELEQVIAVAPGADAGVQEAPANEVAFPGTQRKGAIDVSVTNEAGLPADPQPVEPGPAVGEAETS